MSTVLTTLASLTPHARRRAVWLTLTAALLLACIWTWRARTCRSAAVYDYFHYRGAAHVLKTPVHLDFTETPLAEALAAVGRQAHCTITLNYPNDGPLRGLFSNSPDPFPITEHSTAALPLKDAIDALVAATGKPIPGTTPLGMEVDPLLTAWQTNHIITISPPFNISPHAAVTLLYDIPTLADDASDRPKAQKWLETELAKTSIPPSQIRFLHYKIIITANPEQQETVATLIRTWIKQTDPFPSFRPNP